MNLKKIYERKNKCYQIIRNKIKFKNENKDFNEIILEIQNNLRSTESKISFDWMKKLTIIHPTRRDGGIMNCYLDENGELIFEKR